MQKSKLTQRAEGARKFMSKIHLALTRYNLRVASALIERPVLLKPGCWRQRTASFCSECVSRLAYYSVRTGRTSARRPYLLAFWCDSRLPSSRGNLPRHGFAQNDKSPQDIALPSLEERLHGTVDCYQDIGISTQQEKGRISWPAMSEMRLGGAHGNVNETDEDG